MAIPDSAVSLILHLPARHSHLPIKSPFPHLTLGLPNTSSHCMQLVHPVTKCRCCMASNGNSKHARPTQHRPARARVLSKTLLILHTLLHCGFPFRTYVRTMCSTTNHTCLRVGHRIHCRSKVGFKIITSRVRHCSSITCSVGFNFRRCHISSCCCLCCIPPPTASVHVKMPVYSNVILPDLVPSTVSPASITEPTQYSLAGIRVIPTLLSLSRALDWKSDM